EKHHDRVVQLQIIRGFLRDILYPPHCIITEITNSSARKGRQSSHRNGSVPLCDFSHYVDQATLAFLGFSSPNDFHNLDLGFDDQIRIATDERVPGNLLSSFDAFQQKGMGHPSFNLQVSENRREQVSCDRLRQWNDVSLSA